MIDQNRLLTIKNAIKERENRLRDDLAHNRVINQQIDAASTEIGRDAIRYKDVQDAMAFLESFASVRRNQLKNKIEHMLCESVQLVYGTDHAVEIEHSMKNNRGCVDFFITQKTENGVVRRTNDGMGSGMSDVISLPLRLMLLLSSNTDRVCFLDESYKQIGEEHIDTIGEFLHDLAKRLDIQIILCTHHKGLVDYANQAWEVTWNGASSVKRVK